MHIVVQNALQKYIQIGKVFQMFVLVLHLVAKLGQLAIRTTAVVDAAICNLNEGEHNILVKLSVKIYN